MRAYGAASLYWLTCNLHIGILVDNQTLSRASSSRNLLGSCRHDKVCTALGIWLTPPTFEAPTTTKCRYNATHATWDLLTSDQCDRVEDRRSNRSGRKPCRRRTRLYAWQAIDAGIHVELQGPNKA